MKGIIALIVIILVLGTILGIMMFSPNNETSSKITETEVKALVQKGAEQKNYYAKYNMIGAETEIWVKDDIALSKKDKYITWKNNVNPSENLLIDTDKKTALTGSQALASMDSNDYYGSSYIYAMNREDSKIKDIKQERYNNEECIVFKIEGYANYTVWLSKETGLILKTIMQNEGLEALVTEYNVKVNLVTEQDVKKPSTTGYNVVNTNR